MFDKTWLRRKATMLRTSRSGYSVNANILHCCDLVLNIDGSQSLVDLVQDPLALEAAASAVQTSYDDAVRADQHRVPAEGETVAHSLTTGGAVAEQSREERQLAELRAENLSTPVCTQSFDFPFCLTSSTSTN